MIGKKILKETFRKTKYTRFSWSVGKIAFIFRKVILNKVQFLVLKYKFIFFYTYNKVTFLFFILK